MNIMLTPIADLSLSVRTSKCLEWNDIYCIKDLVIKTEDEMLEIPNFGKISLNEIKEKLHPLGLGFGMSPKEMNHIYPSMCDRCKWRQMTQFLFLTKSDDLYRELSSIKDNNPDLTHYFFMALTKDQLNRVMAKWSYITSSVEDIILLGQGK